MPPKPLFIFLLFVPVFAQVQSSFLGEPLHHTPHLSWLIQSSKAFVIPAAISNEVPNVRPRHTIFYADKAPWHKAVEALIEYNGLSH